MRPIPRIGFFLYLLTLLPLVVAGEWKLDFGTEAGTATGWVAVAPGAGILHLGDGIEVELDPGFLAEGVTSWESAPPEWPEAVLSDYLALGEGQTEARIVIRGLDDQRDYRIWLTAFSQADSALASYTVNGLTTSGAVFNTGQHPTGLVEQAVFWPIVRSEGGTVVLEVQGISGTPTGHLNGLILEDRTEANQPANYYQEWTFPEDSSPVRLYVDSNFSGSEDGSSERPFTSISAAVEAARLLDAEGRGASIRIRSGEYRESVFIANRVNSKPLLLVGEEPGRVVILGSERISEWELTETGYWQTHWPYQFGYDPNPWPDNLPLEVPGFRREILFLDGEPLRQALSLEELDVGQYFVDEANQQLLIHLEEAADPHDHRMEVSVRGRADGLLKLEQVDNIHIENLVLKHAANAFFAQGALALRGARQVILRDVVIADNNGMGLEFNPWGGRQTQNVVLDRVIMDRNGTMGMTGVVHNMLAEGCSTSHNNWRGLLFGVDDWAPCGFKLALSSGVILRDMRVHNNQANGAWVDMHNSYIAIEGMQATSNRQHGLDLEANYGPIHVRDSLMAANGGIGFFGFDNTFVQLVGNVLFDNRLFQLQLIGWPAPDRDGLPIEPRWWRERQAMRQLPSWYSLENNSIGVTRGSIATRPLMDFEVSPRVYLDGEDLHLERLRRTWTSDNNTYFHFYPPSIPSLMPDLQGGTQSFPDFQGMMDSDHSSTWVQGTPDSLQHRLADFKLDPDSLNGPDPDALKAPASGRFYDPSTRGADFGLRNSEWMGPIFVHYLPWLYHYGTGWLMVGWENESGAWLYNPLQAEWLWVAAESWPWVYSVPAGQWRWLP